MSKKTRHLLHGIVIFVLAWVTLNDFVLAPNEYNSLGNDMMGHSGGGWNFLYWFLRYSVMEWHRIPFINSFLSCGVPYFSEIQNPIYYFPIILLSASPNEFVAIRYSILLHTIISGIAMYTLMIVWKQTAEASLVSAIGFMFSGYLFSTIYSGHLSLLYGYSWIPLVLAAFELALQKKSKTYAVLAGLPLSLQIHSGGINIFFHTIFFLSIYAIYRCLNHTDLCFIQLGVGKVCWKRVYKSVLMIISSLFLALSFAFMLSAVKILPFMEISSYIRLPGRQVSWENIGIGTIKQSSVKLDNLINTMVSRDVMSDESTFYLGSLMISLPVVLICNKSLKKNRSLILFLTITTLMLWALSVGYYLTLLPLLGTWMSIFLDLIFGIFFFFKWIRIQSRFLILTQLTISALAGFLTTELQNRLRNNRSFFKLDLSRILVYFMVGLVMVDLVSYGITYVEIGEVHTGKNQVMRYLSRHTMNDIPFRIYITDPFAFSDYGDMHSYPRNGFECVNAEGFVHVNAYADLLSYAERHESMKILGLLNTKYVISHYELDNPKLIFEYSAKHWSGRRLRLYRNEYFVQRIHPVDHAILVVYSDQELWKNISRRIIDQEGFDPRKTTVLLANRPLEDFSVDELRLFDVIFLADEDIGVDLTERELLLELYQQYGGTILRPSEAIPRSILDKINQSVVNTSIQIQSYTSDRLDAEIVTTQTGFLQISQAYLPGWNVYCNGKRMKLFQANDALFAIILPEGKTTIRLTFEPISFRIGSVLSSIACLTLVVSIIWSSRRSLQEILRLVRKGECPVNCK